jgi:microsomal dipeptidase-like Zn-dependent dipeptidase
MVEHCAAVGGRARIGLRRFLFVLLLAFAVAGTLACSGDRTGGPADVGGGADSSDAIEPADGRVGDVSADLGDGNATVPDVPPVPLQGLGGQCVVVRVEDGWLAAKSGEAFAFGPDVEKAARFYLQPSDLETYLLYDEDKGHLVDKGGTLGRATELQSDVTLVDDGYISEAEWIFEPHQKDPSRYQLRNRRTGGFVGADGVGSTAAAVVFEPAQGCTPYPELSVDASGTVTRTTFEDGTLYGIADIHEHIMTNLSFGGGIYHGAAFHRLGVPHALPDCSVIHGPDGRKDFFGYVNDVAGIGGDALMMLLDAFLSGILPEKLHATAGWPDFTDWPDARHHSSHQTMYYRWIERAWMAGMRLTVQLATTDYVICGLMVGGGINPSRYDCEDMTAVDRILDETWAMQRYIDAQWGGEGKGWFRIVTSPAEAREVIAAGKLAVVLGIETSNPFRCYLTPRPGGPTCDEAWVEQQLDEYHARGVRAVFPVHKFDNRFSPGDGSRGFLQAGNFLLSGHWLNYTQDCVTDDMPTGWDHGGITFGGLVSPRDEYLSPAPEDLSGYVDDPLYYALKYFDKFTAPPLEGEWCQKATITPVGEALFEGLMKRGMIVEIDHFPQWSYRRSYEILEANDYPGVGSHGRHWNGRLFATGGVSSFGIGRCQDPDNPGASVKGIADAAALIESKGQYPGVSFGFDFNGIAGAPGPRFAEGACGKEQPNPTQYPFKSYAGDVEFTAPYVGNRAIDFDQEGMVHIGLLPELIRDAQADAPDDAMLEPLFRSAEAYIRMWEKAEKRGAEIRSRR